MPVGLRIPASLYVLSFFRASSAFQYSPGTPCKTVGEPCSYTYIPFGDPPAEEHFGYCAPNHFCMDNGAYCTTDDECFGWCGNGICGGETALCNSSKRWYRTEFMPFWDHPCFTPDFKCSAKGGEIGQCIPSDGTEVWEEEEEQEEPEKEKEKEEEEQKDFEEVNVDGVPQIILAQDNDPHPLHLRHEDTENKKEFVDPFRQPERYMTHEEVVLPEPKFESDNEPEGLTEEESLQWWVAKGSRVLEAQREKHQKLLEEEKERERKRKMEGPELAAAWKEYAKLHHNDDDEEGEGEQEEDIVVPLPASKPRDELDQVQKLPDLEELEKAYELLNSVMPELFEGKDTPFFHHDQISYTVDEPTIKEDDQQIREMEVLKDEKVDEVDSSTMSEDDVLLQDIGHLKGQTSEELEEEEDRVWKHKEPVLHLVREAHRGRLFDAV